MNTVAVVLCPPVVRDYLTNYARPLIFSSAAGLPTLVATRTAYELMAEGGTIEVLCQSLHTDLAADPI